MQTREIIIDGVCFKELLTGDYVIQANELRSNQSYNWGNHHITNLTIIGDIPRAVSLSFSMSSTSIHIVGDVNIDAQVEAKNIEISGDVRQAKLRGKEKITIRGNVADAVEENFSRSELAAENISVSGTINKKNVLWKESGKYPYLSETIIGLKRKQSNQLNNAIIEENLPSKKLKPSENEQPNKDPLQLPEIPSEYPHALKEYIQRLGEYLKQPLVYLRPHQRKRLEQYYRGLLKNKRRAVFEMATGTGKTVMFSALASLINNRNSKTRSRALIVTSRTNLRDQIMSTVKRYGSHLSIGETLKCGMTTQDVVVVNYQELVNILKHKDVNYRKDEKNWVPLFEMFDHIYLDEAHNAMGEKGVELVKQMKAAMEKNKGFIGFFTATPYNNLKTKKNKKKKQIAQSKVEIDIQDEDSEVKMPVVENVYQLAEVTEEENPIDPYKIKEAIEDDVLAPVKIAILKPKLDEKTQKDLSSASGGTQSEEVNAQKVGRAINKDKYNQLYVNIYANESDPELGTRFFGTQFMVFCAGVKHAEAVAKAFNDSIKVEGNQRLEALRDKYVQNVINREQPKFKNPAEELAYKEKIRATFKVAAALHKGTKLDGKKMMNPEADRIEQQYRDGGILVLTGSDKITEGFDHHKVRGIINAKPTKSKRLSEQRAGRAFRLSEEDYAREPGKREKVAYVIDVDWQIKNQIFFKESLDDNLRLGKLPQEKINVSDVPLIPIEGKAESSGLIWKEEEILVKLGWIKKSNNIRKFKNASSKEKEHTIEQIVGDLNNKINGLQNWMSATLEGLSNKMGISKLATNSETSSDEKTKIVAPKEKIQKNNENKKEKSKSTDNLTLSSATKSQLKALKGNTKKMVRQFQGILALLKETNQTDDMELEEETWYANANQNNQTNKLKSQTDLEVIKKGLQNAMRELISLQHQIQAFLGIKQKIAHDINTMAIESESVNILEEDFEELITKFESTMDYVENLKKETNIDFLYNRVMEAREAKTKAEAEAKAKTEAETLEAKRKQEDQNQLLAQQSKMSSAMEIESQQVHPFVPTVILQRNRDVLINISEPIFIQLLAYIRDGNTQMVMNQLNQYSILSHLKFECAKPLIANRTQTNLNYLHLAVIFNHKNLAERLVNNKSINEAAGLGYTPLHLAALYGHEEMCQWLLTKGANPNLRNFLGETAADLTANSTLKTLLQPTSEILWLLKDFIESIKNGPYEKFKALLDAYPGLVNTTVDDEVTIIEQENKKIERIRMSPLHVACMTRNNKDINRIIQELTQRNADVNAVDSKGQTPLLITVSKNSNLNTVITLLNNGADCNVRGKDTLTALHFAAALGSLQTAKELILHGANVNAKDKRCATPLYYASLYGFNDLCSFLLTHGADANLTTDDDSTPLHKAVLKQNYSLCKLLLEKNANTEIKDKKGKTPSDYAMFVDENIKKLFPIKPSIVISKTQPFKNSIKIPKDVIEQFWCNIKKSYVNDAEAQLREYPDLIHLRNKYRPYATVLQTAAKSTESFFNMLLKLCNASDILATDANNETILHYAAREKKYSVLENILSKYSNELNLGNEELKRLINKKSNSGQTALSLATEKNATECCKFLITLGADPNNYENINCSPLHIAAYNGNYEITKYLLDNKAIAEVETLLKVQKQLRKLKTMSTNSEQGNQLENYHFTKICEALQKLLPATQENVVNSTQVTSPTIIDDSDASIKGVKLLPQQAPIHMPSSIVPTPFSSVQTHSIFSQESKTLNQQSKTTIVLQKPSTPINLNQKKFFEGFHLAAIDSQQTKKPQQHMDYTKKF